MAFVRLPWRLVEYYYQSGKRWRLTKDWHRLIADYFENLSTWKEPPDIGKPGLPTRRKVAELPYHLTYSQEWTRLENALADLEFIEAKCTAGMTYELVGDYNTALDRMPMDSRKGVEEFARFVRSQSHNLSQYPGLTFPQRRLIAEDS